MKKLATIALLVLAGLAGARASAQDVRADYRYVQIQYSPDGPPVEVVALYQINGDMYPVGRWMRIWGRMGDGRWRVTGRIIRYPYGDVAVAFDGTRAPAVRWNEWAGVAWLRRRECGASARVALYRRANVDPALAVRTEKDTG